MVIGVCLLTHRTVSIITAEPDAGLAGRGASLRECAILVSTHTVIRQCAVYACRSVNTCVSTPTLRSNILNSSRMCYPWTSAVRSTSCQWYAHTNSNKCVLVRSYLVYYSLHYSTTRPPRTCHEHAQVITKKLRPYMQNTLATSHIHTYCLSVTSGVVLTLGAHSQYVRMRWSSIFPNMDKLPRYQLHGLLSPL
jgi:hypothetical protein